MASKLVLEAYYRPCIDVLKMQQETSMKVFESVSLTFNLISHTNFQQIFPCAESALGKCEKMLKVNIVNIVNVVLASLLLTLNILYTFFWSFVFIVTMYLFAGFSEDIFEMLAGSISKKEVQSKL